MTTAVLRRATPRKRHKRIPEADRHHFVGFCDRCDQLATIHFTDGLCQPCRDAGAR